MTVAAPWSVKGIDPEAREVAKSAARKEGLTLGQWLTAMILEASGQDYASGSGRRHGFPDEKIERLEERLAELTRQQQLTAAGRVLDEQSLLGPVEALINRMDRHERRTVEAFEAINDRLSGLARQLGPASTLEKAPDIPAALETALRQIVGHIALSEQRNREELDALRTRLAALVGDAGSLHGTEAEAARDAALQRMESRVATLAERLEAAERVIEAETPVQAYDDSEVFRQIDLLSQRLLAMADERNADSASAQISDLSARIDELDERFRTSIEEQPGSDLLVELQNHILALTDKLAAVEQRFGDIGAVERSIAELFTAMEQSKAETRALATQTAEEAVARSLNAHRELAESATPQPDATSSAELQALKNGLAAVRNSIAQADRQTQETLVIVHDTLQKIVDRLTAVEERLDAGDRSGSEGDDEGGKPRSAGAQEAGASSAEIPEMLRDVRVPPMLEREAVEAPAHPAALAAEPEERPATDTDVASEISDEQLAAANSTPTSADPTEPQLSFPSPAERQIETITRRDDFIAAARRAAQAASQMPQAPTRRFGPLSKLRALGRARGGDETTNTEPSGTDTKRKPLILAGAILLLLAVSAYSLTGKHQNNDVASTDAEGPAKSEQQANASDGQDSSGWSATAITEWLQRLVDNRGSTSEGENTPADPIATGSIGKSSSVLTPPAASRAIASATPVSTRPAYPAGGGDPAGVKNPASVAALQEPIPLHIGPRALREAALSGDPTAQFMVATRLLEGDGPSDAAAAMRWFQKAAAQGSGPAQYRLGMMFERGTGVPRDLATARVWYLRAAEKGNVKAMHNLAVAYASDDRRQPDYAKAARWFAAAADYGIRDSQYNYGILLEKGLGTEKDLQAAYKWLSLCAHAGDDEAAGRAQILKAQLTDAQRAQADKEIASWRPRVPEQAANTVALQSDWEDLPPRLPGQRAELTRVGS